MHSCSVVCLLYVCYTILQLKLGLKSIFIFIINGVALYSYNIDGEMVYVS